MYAMELAGFLRDQTHIHRQLAEQSDDPVIDVRFGAHYGLKSDIGPCPLSARS
jgi:hypothetical protein